MSVQSRSYRIEPAVRTLLEEYEFDLSHVSLHSAPLLRGANRPALDYRSVIERNCIA